MEVKLQTLLGFGTMEGKKVTIQGVDGEGQEEQASQECMEHRQSWTERRSTLVVMQLFSVLYAVESPTLH